MEINSAIFRLKLIPEARNLSLELGIYWNTAGHRSQTAGKTSVPDRFSGSKSISQFNGFPGQQFGSCLLPFGLPASLQHPQHVDDGTWTLGVPRGPSRNRTVRFDVGHKVISKSPPPISSRILTDHPLTQSVGWQFGRGDRRYIISSGTGSSDSNGRYRRKGELFAPINNQRDSTRITARN